MPTKNVVGMVVACVLMLASGIATAQRQGASKFAKYLRPASISAMDFVMLRANVDLIRGGRTIVGIPAPEIFYDPEHSQIHANIFIDGIGKYPLNKARLTIEMTAKDVVYAVRRYVPDLGEEDFVLTVDWLNDGPDASKRETLGTAAREVIAANQGATKRSLDCLAGLLK